MEREILTPTKQTPPLKTLGDLNSSLVRTLVHLYSGTALTFLKWEQSCQSCCRSTKTLYLTDFQNNK